jgi:hypothetical protein
MLRRRHEAEHLSLHLVQALFERSEELRIKSIGLAMRHAQRRDVAIGIVFDHGRSLADPALTSVTFGPVGKRRSLPGGHAGCDLANIRLAPGIGLHENREGPFLPCSAIARE